ncbi:MAG TPA: TonB family protein [Polyangia bacterium]|nr:TonB family protein [Polyangia bacterium]
MLAAALAVSTAPPSRARGAEAPPPKFEPPRLTHFVEAVPPASLSARRQAEVVLTIDVDETGKVTSVEVAKPAGGPDGPAFDAAALAAARQFIFAPGEADGHPVPVRITYSYRFVLKPPPPPPAPPEAPVPTVPLSGIVRRRGDRAPVAGAVALCAVAPGDERRAVTGADGRFAFAALPVGEHRLVVRGVDLAPVDVPVALHAGKATEVSLYVDVKERYASTVRGRRAVVETVEQTLTTAEIQRIPGTQGDTLKAVQNLPGVARAPFGIGLLPVWGSAPADTRVYIDGVNVPVLYHFGGLRSTVNSEMVDALTFVPGGYEADHGLGLGGIVDVDTRRPRTDGLHGYAQIDLLDGSLMLEGPLGKTLSFAVAGRRSWIDATLPLFTTSSFQLSPVYYDYQGRLTWRPTGRDVFDLFVFGSDDRLSLLARVKDDALDAAVDSHIYFHRAVADWSHRFDRGRTLSVTSSVGYDAPFGFGVSFGQIPTSIDEHALAYATRAVGRWPLGETLRLDGGVDFEGDRWAIARSGSPAAVTDLTGGAGAGGLGANGGFGGSASGFATDDLTLYTNHVAPFVSATWSPFDRLTVTPQFRLQVMTFAGYQGTPAAFARGFVSPEPRLALRYRLTARVALKGAVGLYAQPPDPTAFSRVFGNPNLVPERGTQYVLGADVELPAGLTGEVDLFWKSLRDLVVSGENPGEPPLDNEGVGRAYGGQLLVRRNLGKRLYGWLAYTLSRSERKDHPDQAWYPFAFDQTNILTAMLTYLLPRGWQVGGRFRYVTGDPYTPVTGSFYDSVSDGYVAIAGAINSARLGAFDQLDLRADKIFTFDRWRFSAYLDVQNVFRADNPEAVGYNYNYTIAHPITGLPLLPILGVRGDF